MELRERVVREFADRYGELPAAVVRAPGRVNLIGEHTDYNDGFVFPMAIDRAVWIALRPAAEGKVAVFSLDFAEEKRFGLEELDGPGQEGWLEYLKGTAWALKKAGWGLKGWEGVLAGDVPIGAGLSSSAALEMATARAFAFTAELGWEPGLMARLGQQAENQWVGVNCGLMDQMISAAGRAEHALLLDCRSLEYELVPLPPGTAVVVLDTGTRRGLVDSAYNERRAQCEAAAGVFGVKALRDVTLEQFQERQKELDPTTRRRAHHVISENARTVRAAEAMRQRDAAHLGELMNASHASLRDDFEVSSAALDTIVECARQRQECLGARMTGAGFGGCAVALAPAREADAFGAAVAADYRRATGHEPAVYVCRATSGAQVVD
jgi:galactokinase